MADVPQQRKVWQYTGVGEMPSVLRQTSIPMPAHSNSGIIVQVAATALNPVDLKLVSPSSVLRLLSTKPGIPGLDYSGIVVGGNLEGTSFKVGMPVYGIEAAFLGVR